MTPKVYKARYDNLLVQLGDGTSELVRLNQYRLRSLNYNAVAARAFLDKLRERGIDMELCVYTDTGMVRVDPDLTKAEKAFKQKTGMEVVMSVEDVATGQKIKVDTKVADWSVLARYVFAGKGSPEHCQIVLQLAYHWGLAPNLQGYADTCLGLDCNGFVGNYLWHGKRKKPWTNLGVGNLDLGPDAWISGYFDGKKLVSKLDEIDKSKSYILGMVDKTGNIVRGGPGSVSGHIAITEPGLCEDRWLSNGSKSLALRSVESTAGHTPGLWESWYNLRSVKNKIFDVDREEMRQGSRYLSFKIAAVD